MERGGRRARRWLATALAGAFAVTGLAGCGGDGEDEATRLPGEVVVDDQLRFDPEEFEVRFERETTFTLVNEDDDRKHNFTLSYVFVDADNFVTVDVEPNSTAEVKFTVRERPANGYFTFYCRYHQSEGMSGRITVA